MFHRWGRGRRPAYAWSGAYQPNAKEDREPVFPRHILRIIRLMARRFPFGGETPFFGRGELKYGLLELLLERPKHGYEMIKELESKAGGFYTPSAGAVYPALQLMEDRDWITSQVVDGKKVYTITDAGRKALEEDKQNAETFGGRRGWGHEWSGRQRKPFGPFGQEPQPEFRALRHETKEVGRLLWAAVMAAGRDPAKLTKLRTIIAETRQRIDELLHSSEEGNEKKKNIF